MASNRALLTSRKLIRNVSSIKKIFNITSTDIALECMSMFSVLTANEAIAKAKKKLSSWILQKL
jgi:ApbE superfamily uncharacterized protein (UPF0280 family)